MNTENSGDIDALTVIRATPELADYCAESAPRLNLTLLETLKQCSLATIPNGHRADFMAGAMLYLWEKGVVPRDPRSLRFVETDAGDVFWKEMA